MFEAPTPTPTGRRRCVRACEWVQKSVFVTICVDLKPIFLVEWHTTTTAAQMATRAHYTRGLVQGAGQHTNATSPKCRETPRLDIQNEAVFFSVSKLQAQKTFFDSKIPSETKAASRSISALADSIDHLPFRVSKMSNSHRRRPVSHRGPD